MVFFLHCFAPSSLLLPPPPHYPPPTSCSHLPSPDTQTPSFPRSTLVQLGIFSCAEIRTGKREQLFTLQLSSKYLVSLLFFASLRLRGYAFLGFWEAVLFLQHGSAKAEPSRRNMGHGLLLLAVEHRMPQGRETELFRFPKW